MKILLTGNEGFVGNHIQSTLEAKHEVIGLEAQPSFQEWYDEMNTVLDTSIDAVVHVGAIAENQSERMIFIFGMRMRPIVLRVKVWDVPALSFSLPTLWTQLVTNGMSAPTTHGQNQWLKRM